ncbi:hypothetical protein [Orenia marismortui]|uniref:Prepilin-type N-terminal cleavage/methylation domain-containing protein n=1 Tax=Orenia marismortui TaxID=46469 RepID=A0A4R8H0R9_9FIRM|nr:hypothetical protein [Orenia marismortui]TDX53032.1 hypothetical protein C7959_104162 [Orenia marismortui]
MRRIFSQEEGITIIELLVSVTVLSIIVISFATAFGYSAKILKKVHQENQAIHKDQEAVENNLSINKPQLSDQLKLSFVGTGEKEALNLDIDGGVAYSGDISTFIAEVPYVESVELTPELHVYGDEPNQIKIKLTTKSLEDGTDVTADFIDPEDPDNPLFSSTTYTIEDNEVTISLSIPTGNSRPKDGVYTIVVDIKDMDTPLELGYLVNPIRMVAVGEKGSILTSYNGDKWADQSQATNKDLNDVIWDGDRAKKQFVVVGEDGIILTSENGVDWEEENLEDVGDLEAVAYGNDRFVAVGEAGAIYSSTYNKFTKDYSGWTPWKDTALGVTIDCDLNDIIFDGPWGNNRFVIAADSSGENNNDLFYTEEDKWRGKTFSQQQDWINIDYGGPEDEFLLIADKQMMAFDYDLEADDFSYNQTETVNSNQPDLEKHNLQDMTALDGAYLVVGVYAEGDDDQSPKIYYYNYENNDNGSWWEPSLSLPLNMTNFNLVNWYNQQQIMGGLDDNDKYQILIYNNQIGNWSIAKIDESFDADNLSINNLFIK